VLVWLIAPEVGENELSATSPKVGVGPFMFDSYQTDVQMNYIRHPEYFLNPMPYFERIERPILAEEATQDSNFRSGSLDRLSISEKDRVEELLGAVNGATRNDYFSWSMVRIALARHLPPFDDVEVRRAVSMAIDRDELGVAMDSIDYKWASHAFGAGYTPWYIDPQSSDFGEPAKYFEYNPEEAKAIMDAKHPDGLELPYILTPEYAGAVIIGEYLADKLSKIGITTKIESYTYTEYQNKYRVGPLEDRLWEGLLDERFASRADPTGWFLVYHSPSASRQVTKFEDATFEQMIADQEVELDQEARVQKVQEIQRHMAENMIGVPLLSESSSDLNQPRLKNFIYKLDAGRTAEGHIQAWLEPA
jgi:peptide/nickel transport system substrate-binding protein